MRQIKRIKSNINYFLAILIGVALLLSLYVTITDPDHHTKRTPGKEELAQDAAGQAHPTLQSSGLQSSHASKNEHVPQTKETDVVIHPSPTGESTAIGYMLVVESGYLQVYDRSTNELYMETDIAYELLPDQIQWEIDNGKYFLSEEALLEFLENYSS